MSERFALPRRESAWHMTDEDLSRIEALNARLRPLADSPTVKPVLVTYWTEGMDMPIERWTIASHMLPSATGLIPSSLDWASQATHVTIETPE